jgi:hypothetical protein
MKPHFYVHRVTGTQPPRVKHLTAESAQKEAERLAGQYPGEAFEILKCVAVSHTVVAKTFWMDGEQAPWTA